MDNISWSFPIWITLLCLLPILAFAIFVMWRAKDVQAGVRLFLVLSIPITLLIFTSWLIMRYVPRDALETIVILYVGGIIVFVCVSGFIHWINTIKAGMLLENGKDSDIDRNRIFGFIWLGVAVFGLLTIKERFSGMTSWAALFAGILLGQTFLSFQIRERGIISRGRFIKYEDIKSMKWANLRSKEEVDITFQDSDRPRRLKIPWKFIIPIDNYISTHFPCT